MLQNHSWFIYQRTCCNNKWWNARTTIVYSDTFLSFFFYSYYLRFTWTFKSDFGPNSKSYTPDLYDHWSTVRTSFYVLVNQFRTQWKNVQCFIPDVKKANSWIDRINYNTNYLYKFFFPKYVLHLKQYMVVRLVLNFETWIPKTAEL